MAQEHVHLELGQEVTAIGGHYVLVKEVRLPFRGREILYLVGHAAFDTSCCGAGGCAYALVPGFLLSWKDATNEDGQAISKVEPIVNQGMRKQVQASIEEKEVVHQVRFL